MIDPLGPVGIWLAVVMVSVGFVIAGYLLRGEVDRARRKRGE